MRGSWSGLGSERSTKAALGAALGVLVVGALGASVAARQLRARMNLHLIVGVGGCSVRVKITTSRRLVVEVDAHVHRK